MNESLLANITAAFESDGFNVVSTVKYEGRLGVKAEHKTAINYETKQPKTAYYLEGSGYEMGYLLGLMASPQAEDMCKQFMNNIIPSFFSPNTPTHKIEWFWALLVDVLSKLDAHMKEVVPQPLLDEMHGLADAAAKVGGAKHVTFERLLTLNAGIDVALSLIYDLDGLWRKQAHLVADDLRVPVFCNGFSVFGKATKERAHYMGRDFMFPTADIFQDVAAMIIYNPKGEQQAPLRKPMVAMTAPGFIGSITTLNTNGLAMGVDMAPSGNNNPHHPGLNSLLLIRHTSHVSANTDEAVAVMTQAKRGVSWLYLTADGATDKAAVIEAGLKIDDLNPLSYPSKDLIEEGLLPTQAFLDDHAMGSIQQGLFARYADYSYPKAFFEFNPGLFAHFEKPFVPRDFGEEGFINDSDKDKNNPDGFYFAPQREVFDDMVLATNIFIEPRMRLCAMHAWTNLVAGYQLNNLQWRYDALNKLLIDAYGSIDKEKAKALIEFLAPYGAYPDYYAHNMKSSDGKTVVINGATSVCDLKDVTMESHYGYFADDWVQITLNKYIVGIIGEK